MAIFWWGHQSRWIRAHPPHLNQLHFFRIWSHSEVPRVRASTYHFQGNTFHPVTVHKRPLPSLMWRRPPIQRSLWIDLGSFQNANCCPHWSTSSQRVSLILDWTQLQAFILPPGGEGACPLYPSPKSRPVLSFPWVRGGMGTQPRVPGVGWRTTLDICVLSTPLAVPSSRLLPFLTRCLLFSLTLHSCWCFTSGYSPFILPFKTFMASIYMDTHKKVKTATSSWSTGLVTKCCRDNFSLLYPI